MDQEPPPVNAEYLLDTPGINWRANVVGGRRRIPKDDPDYEQWRARKKITRGDVTETVGTFHDTIDAAFLACGIDIEKIEALQKSLNAVRTEEEKQELENRFNTLTHPAYKRLRGQGYTIRDLNQ